MEMIARALMQLQSLDELAQHACQSRGGVLGPCELFPLLVAMEDPRENIVCAGNQLQGLAQIVTGHRQQRRWEVAVDQLRVAAHGNVGARRAPAGARRRSARTTETDRLHLPVLLLAVSESCKALRLPVPGNPLLARQEGIAVAQLRVGRARRLTP